MPISECGEDHTTLTAKQLRGHYAKGCRDDLVRQAKREYSQQRYLASKTSSGTRVAAPRDAIPAGSEKATTRTPESVPAPDNSPAPLELHVGTNGPAMQPAALTEEPAAPKPAPVRQIGTTPAQGASRRLQGLVAFGYTPKQLAEACGLPVDAIWWMLIAPPATIQTASHARIADVFKQLRNSPNKISDTVEGRSVARAFALAELHGWAGAYDWEDIDFDQKPAYRGRVFRDESKLQAALADAIAEQVADVADPRDEQFDQLQHDLRRANDVTAELRRALAGHASTIDRQRAEIRRLEEQLVNEVDPHQIQRELTAALTELQVAKQRLRDVDKWFNSGSVHVDGATAGRHVDTTRLVDAPVR